MKNGILPRSDDEPKKWYQRWWKRKTKYQRNIIISALILSIVVLLIVLLCFALTVRIEVCTSESCVRTSMELLNLINPKVDPCDDFYQFACGNFLSKPDLNRRQPGTMDDVSTEEVRSRIRNMLEAPMESRDSLTFSQAKRFYRACMNNSAVEYEGLRTIREVFGGIGGWPLVKGREWDEAAFDWKMAVYKLRHLGVNLDYFFKVVVDKDPRNASQYVLQIQDMEYASNDVSAEVKNFYLDYMVRVAVIFGANYDDAMEGSKEALSVLLDLAKIHGESRKSNNTQKNDRYSLSELQYEYKTIPWYYYLREMLRTAENITYDDPIIVTKPVYLKLAEELLQRTPKRFLANFIAWQTIQYFINYLPGKILDSAYEFLEKVNGKMVKETRSTVCITATSEKMGSVLTATYIKRYFSDETRLRIINLIQKIKIQSKYNLLKLDWLDAKSKELALEKLLSSTEHIISFPELMEIWKENEMYDTVKIEETKLLKAVLEIDTVNMLLEYGKLRKPVSDNWLRKGQFLTGRTILYQPKQNVLKFPMGILQGIYFQSDRPEHMNYGIFGSLIAHEISHIFIEGQYGKLGNLGNLRSHWSPESLMRYKDKLGCLTNQSRKLVRAELGENLKPLRTQDEDLADLAGMRVSYDAYANRARENGPGSHLPGLNYSPDQLFWISSAIRHCSRLPNQKYLEGYASNSSRQSMPKIRVNLPLRNLVEFSNDFGCPAGSGMNPVEKCDIW